MGARTIPILSQTSTPTIKTSAPSPPPGDPMDITTPTDSSAPRGASKSPDGEGSDTTDKQTSTQSADQPPTSNATSMPAPAIAAAAVHQPKIVQTAFIHKLYK
jgi:hypothetical protein